MKIFIGINIVLILLVAGLLGYILNQPEPPFGSISQNPYNYTQLTGAVATTSVIVAGQSTLGSVVITEDQAGAVVLWDATSTAAVNNGLSVRIADFQTAETEGVYTFDVGLTYGLVFASADGFLFAGDWTLTWRRGL